MTARLPDALTAAGTVPPGSSAASRRKQGQEVSFHYLGWVLLPAWEVCCFGRTGDCGHTSQVLSGQRPSPHQEEDVGSGEATGSPPGGGHASVSPPRGLGEQSQGEQRVESHPHCACLLFTGSCPAGPSTPFEEAFEIWKNMALSLEESLTF